jgi:hypothetical protein
MSNNPFEVNFQGVYEKAENRNGSAWLTLLERRLAASIVNTRL